MTDFAKVKDGTVIDIIVAEQDFIDNLPKEDNVEWVQSDPQTYHNRHYGLDGKPDGGTPLRGNFAIIGGMYDKEKDIFCDAKPGIDWTLDEYLKWQPPIPFPMHNEEVNNLDLTYEWNDELYQKSNKTKGWVSVDI